MPAVLEQSLYNYLYNMIGQFSPYHVILYREIHFTGNFLESCQENSFNNSLYRETLFRIPMKIPVEFS